VEEGETIKVRAVFPTAPEGYQALPTERTVRLWVPRGLFTAAEGTPPLSPYYDDHDISVITQPSDEEFVWTLERTSRAFGGLEGSDVSVQGETAWGGDISFGDDAQGMPVAISPAGTCMGEWLDIVGVSPRYLPTSEDKV